jgi:hypothetical protein
MAKKGHGVELLRFLFPMEKGEHPFIIFLEKNPKLEK